MINGNVTIIYGSHVKMIQPVMPNFSYLCEFALTMEVEEKEWISTKYVIPFTCPSLF